MCFPHSSTPLPTKCSCARCLKTDKCDQRCQIFEDCDETLSFKCPCRRGRNAGRHYPTCAACLAGCPSGLSCFGIGFCEVVSVACAGAKKPTCP